MWLPDCHAETVAEERRVPDLYPFLGLKFPPQTAVERHKYVGMRVRIIGDATSFNSTVIGTFDPKLRPISVTAPDGQMATARCVAGEILCTRTLISFRSNAVCLLRFQAR